MCPSFKALMEMMEINPKKMGLSPNNRPARAGNGTGGSRCTTLGSTAPWLAI
jgi:hypothetical protein